MLDRLRSQSRTVIAFLAVVLVVLASVSVWGAQRTQAAAGSATEASQLFDAYASATAAVSDLESLERKYRLEPGPDVAERYATAAADFEAALTLVRARGSDADRLLAGRVTALQRDYLEAIHRMFAAVDAGRDADVMRIDSEEVDPVFEAIVTSVRAAADSHHAAALATLDRLAETEDSVFLATLGTCLVGLAILALLLRILTSHLRRMRWLAQHDVVTGLPNRAHFHARVTSALVAAAEDDRSVAVMILDLDRFKEVNDTLGHHVGDDLLGLIGPRLRTVLRAEDTVARLGGDEFGILLTRRAAAEEGTAAEVARRITEAFRAPFIVADLALQIEGSMGITLAPAHGHDVATLLQRADVAMYAAKRAGTNAEIYDPALDDNTPRRLKLLSELRDAIELQQLVLLYQPKVSLADRRLSGVEALLRWEHPTEGVLSPNEFIPLAESSGLIHELTRYVLARAVHQAHAWKVAGYHVPVAVNLSARCLLDTSLPSAVSEVLRREDFPPELLTLEVTETAAMINPIRAATILRRIAALGVKLSIDDFGTGYTSMAYLSELPMHELKIDMSFVQRMLTDRKADAVVRTSIDLAARMGMTVVAEGVEDATTERALTAYGCDQMQGFLMARPQTAQDLEPLLHGSAWDYVGTSSAQPRLSTT